MRMLASAASVAQLSIVLPASRLKQFDARIRIRVSKL
jgi:hypothetical protein